jgi:hypothetical protein
VTARRTAVVIAAWGVGLLLLAALGPVVGERDAVALSQLPAAALGTFAIALAAALLLRDPGIYDVPDASVGAAALGIGLTLAGAGAAVGLWLVLLAAPVVLLGVIALVLERRP